MTNAEIVHRIFVKQRTLAPNSAFHMASSVEDDKIFYLLEAMLEVMKEIKVELNEKDI